MVRISCLGKVSENKFGQYVVVDHSESEFITVQFERTGTVAKYPMPTFKKNQCYDFMQPTVYGVGFLGELIKNDMCETKKSANVIWRAMLRRCYFEDTWRDRPKYERCFVSDEWKNLKTFKNYIKDQKEKGFYHKGYQLDKDILVTGNTVYSEHNCVFLPFILNSLQQVDKKSQGGYLPGVNFSKDRNKYKAEVYFENKKYFLGRFENEIDAFEKYKSAKESLVRDGIAKWEGLIDPRAFKAFSEYSIDWIYESERYKNLKE